MNIPARYREWVYIVVAALGVVSLVFMVLGAFGVVSVDQLESGARVALTWLAGISSLVTALGGILALVNLTPDE